MAGSMLVTAIVVLAGIAAVAGPLIRRRGPEVPPLPMALKGVNRRTAGWRWGGIAAGVVAAAAVASSDGLGRGLLLAAPVFGWCVLVGVVVGESRVVAPGGPSRSAQVEVRQIRDYLPRGLTRTVAGTTGALLLLLTATTLAGSPDDLGRAGRTLYRQCSSDVAVRHGPWPGSYYTLPLAGIVTLGLIIAYVSLRTIVTRPRSGIDPVSVSVDDALRRRSARAVVGACGVLVAIPMAGVCVTAAGGLLGISCRPPWWAVAGWGLSALAPAMIAVAGWCAGAIIAPSPVTTTTQPVS